MKRRLFNAGALVSLAVCTAAAVMWVRSYAAWDGFHVAAGPVQRIEFASRAGRFALEWDVHGRGWGDLKNDGVFIWLGWFLAGFGLLFDGPDRGFVMVPYWLPLALGSTALIYFARRRCAPGLCPACGYDLRGTPSGGTCPECGASKLDHSSG